MSMSVEGYVQYVKMPPFKIAVCVSGVGRRGRFKRIVKLLIAVAAIVLTALCVVLPIILHNSATLQQYFIFRHKTLSHLLLYSARAEDLSTPEDFGLQAAHSFYLQTEGNISVGIWHILPQSLLPIAPDSGKVGLREKDSWFDSSLRMGHPIILYLHGNKLSRSLDYRVELYNTLRKLDYHIITIDYRGYGDSSPVEPNEMGLVTDVKVVFNYFKKKATNVPMIVYGHSLGSAVACHAVAELCEEGKNPDGLILESPFYNLHDELRVHKLSGLFALLPYFNWTIMDPLQQMGDTFRSDQHIVKIPVPIMILHSQDDPTIPFEQGLKLYSSASIKRPKNAAPIKFVEFERGQGYGHNYIHRSPNFLDIIKDFISSSVN